MLAEVGEIAGFTKHFILPPIQMSIKVPFGSIAAVSLSLRYGLCGGDVGPLMCAANRSATESRTDPGSSQPRGEGAQQAIDVGLGRPAMRADAQDAEAVADEYAILP